MFDLQYQNFKLLYITDFILIDNTLFLVLFADKVCIFCTGLIYVSVVSLDNTMSSQKNKACCNPFHCHQKRVCTGLREVSEKMRIDHATHKFQEGDQICTPCRKKLYKVPSATAVQLVQDNAEQESDDVDLSDIDASVPGTSVMPQQSDSLHDIFDSPDYELSLLNGSATVLGLSPINRKKANVSVNYSKHKLRSVEAAVKRKLELVRGAALEESEEEQEEEDTAVTEMIAQLKDKFNMSTKKSEKVQVLMVLPKSWSIRKIVDQFQASNYRVRKN